MQIDTNTITLIIAFANLVLIVIGPVASAVNARADRQEARRREYEEREDRTRREREQYEEVKRKEQEVRTESQRKEAQLRNDGLRLEKQGYIHRAANVLIEQRKKLQYLQDINPLRLHSSEVERLSREREESYGEAYGTMLFVNDSLVRSLAPTVMSTDATPHEKLTAINTAIERLGQLFDETIQSNMP
jgi:hypothetical protein